MPRRGSVVFAFGLRPGLGNLTGKLRKDKNWVVS